MERLSKQTKDEYKELILETQSEDFANFLKEYAKGNNLPEPNVEVIERYKPTKEELENSNNYEEG